MKIYLKKQLIYFIFIVLNNAFVCKTIFTCKNKINNYINGSSNPFTNDEIFIKHFGGLIFNEDGKTPSCYKGRPNVVMPGIVKITHGEVKVLKKYDFIKSGILKMTIKNPKFDNPLCLNGESQYLALPNYFCSLKLCSFIGDKLCKYLSNPGTHTINDLVKKLKFNTTLLLPEPPSIFGISLLDFFSGEFLFEFILEHEGKKVLNLKIPINNMFLQIGLSEDESDEKESLK